MHLSLKQLPYLKDLSYDWEPGNWSKKNCLTAVKERRGTRGQWGSYAHVYSQGECLDSEAKQTSLSREAATPEG